MVQVVVTGLGAITALGNNVEEFQKGLMQGANGIGPISQFQSERVRTRIAAEVKDFNPENHFDKPQLDYLDRFAQFALVASREAVADAGLRFTKKLAQRTAVVHGTGIGGQNTQEASYHSIYACSAKRVHPFTIPKIMPNAGCSHISIEFGITGPSFTTATACSSAGHAIGLAYMMLRQGMVDVALSGGGEACITPEGLIFGHLNVNSIRNKFEALKLFIEDQLDIIAISETKLDDSFPVKQFCIHGYNTPFRVDKSDNSGGYISLCQK